MPRSELCSTTGVFDLFTKSKKHYQNSASKFLIELENREAILLSLSLSLSRIDTLRHTIALGELRGKKVFVILQDCCLSITTVIIPKN